MHRRELLKIGGVAVAGMALAGGGAYTYKRSMLRTSAERERLKSARIVIAGGGSAGITAAARILRAVPEANVTLIEPSAKHHYQPGYTLVAAGIYKPEQVVWDKADLVPSQVNWKKSAVKAFEPESDRVLLEDGSVVEYDVLIVALGVQNNVAAVPGLQQAFEDGNAASVYDLKLGSSYREKALAFNKGTALFVFPPGFVKCGGAPQKICWLSEDLWRSNGVRDQIEVHFSTPAPVLFGAVPVINDVITPMMEQRGIQHHFRQRLMAVSSKDRLAIFMKQKVDATGNVTGSEEVRMQYDLLHAVAPFKAPDVLANSALAATTPPVQGLAEVDPHSLQHKRFANVFAVGDVAAIPAAKTAATIRKQAPVAVENVLDFLLDEPLQHSYDGASGCPLLTRYGRCMMFEFNYDRELLNPWLYQSTQETRRWWHFKLHGLPLMYRHIMLRGLI